MDYSRRNSDRIESVIYSFQFYLYIIEYIGNG